MFPLPLNIAIELVMETHNLEKKRLNIAKKLHPGLSQDQILQDLHLFLPLNRFMETPGNHNYTFSQS